MHVSFLKKGNILSFSVGKRISTDKINIYELINCTILLHLSENIIPC